MMEKKKQNSWHLVKKFFEPVIEKPKNFVMCGIIAFLGAIYSISFAIFLERIVYSIQNNDFNSFVFWVISFFIVVLLWFIIRLNDRKFFFSALYDAESITYTKYMKKFYVGDNTEIEKIGTGRIISILKSGIFNRNAKITETFWIYLKSIFIILFSLGLILSKSFSFFIVSLIFLIFVFLWIRYFGNKAFQFRKETKYLATESDRQSIKQVMSKFETLNNNKIDQELAKYFSFSEKSLQFRLKEKFFQGLGYDGANFFANVLRIAVLFFVGLWVFKSSSTISEFVLFSTLTGILISTIEGLSEIGKGFADSMIHIEKLWETFEKFNKEYVFDKGSNFTYKSGNTKIQNISFSYDKSPVFQNFSLEIKGGKKTAFVGESGGGKTTLIKLLAGYIRPDKGEIEIDGQKLSEIKLTDYYKHIGYLTQDPSVFDGTIHENLIYALDTEPKKEDLDHVIKLSKCEFIREFEKGLETEIGERGVRLSGGQKQRLAIAKIMLKNPNIILLDEPTSALDSFNEEQISIALHNLFKGKTVIVVAHRLQTVKQADRICYIEQGTIIEEGTHEELVKMGGRYKKMLDLQSGF